MCGICGILDRAGDPGTRRHRVSRMTAAMVHRGPDDQGFHDAREISLGFRRLAVIDVETGQQPIQLEDDRAVIVLNGEIYNFRELRRPLEARHRFRSRGDVEVVLRLYAEEGIAAISKLNGMFAMAIWDRDRRTLVLARDRFGIKPLYLCRQGKAFAFASEVGALLAGGYPDRREVDRLQLRHYLAQKYPSPGRAILRGVRSLQPATILEVGPEGERTTRYWTAPEGPPPRMGDREAVERTSLLLAEAARRQLVADVPVGVFLSGGLDSGTLAAHVRTAVERPRTFSVGFDSPDVANELPAAAAAARFLQSEHHELVVTPDRVAGDLIRIFAELDGPLGDATAVPTWYMSRLARETAVVALSGEGADELFGGYDRQRYDLWLDRLGPARRAIPAMLRLAGRPASPRLRARLHEPPGLERQLDWSRVFTAREIADLASDPLPPEEELRALHEDLAKRWRRIRRADPTNARLEADRELFLVGDLLPKVDRMSMAHSLEVRVPYLDNDLAEFVLAQPGHRKIRGNRVKWLLRHCARRVLPAAAASRRKQGFDVPVSAWLRGPLREVACDLLAPAAVRRRGLFRPEVVTRMIESHLRGEADHGQRLWSLLALEGWMRARFDRVGGFP